MTGAGGGGAIASGGKAKVGGGFANANILLIISYKS